LLDHHVGCRKLLLQDTKKIGCKATLLIQEVLTFPDYKVINYSYQVHVFRCHMFAPKWFLKQCNDTVLALRYNFFLLEALKCLALLQSQRVLNVRHTSCKNTTLM